LRSCSNSLFLFWPKLWARRPDALERVELPSQTGEWLYQGGSWLGENLAVSALVFGALSCLVILFHNSRRNLYQIACLILSAFCLVFVLPIGAENILRYWKFAGGYQARGLAGGDNHYGLPTAIFSQTPELILLLSLVGAVWTLVRIFKGSAEVYSMLAIFTLIGGVLVSLGTATLDLSHVVACLPFVYVLAAKGLCSLAKRVGPLASRLILWGVLSFQALGSAYWLGMGSSSAGSGQLPVYYNFLSGGETEAVRRGSKLTLSGQEDAVRFLVQKSGEIEGGVSVATDDFSIPYLKALATRIYQDGQATADSETSTAESPSLEFYSFDDQPWSDYIMTEPTTLAYLKDKQGFGRKYERLQSLDTEPVSFGKGVNLFANGRESLPVEVSDLSKRASTGRLQKYPPEEAKDAPLDGADENGGVSIKTDKVLRALPGWDKEGWLFSNERFRLEPGTYELNVFISTEKGELADPKVKTELSARIEILGCERFLLLGELSPERDGVVRVVCEAKESAPNNIGIWWYGKHAIRFHGFHLKKL